MVMVSTFPRPLREPCSEVMGVVSNVDVVPRDADVCVDPTVPSADEDEDDDSNDSVEVRDSGESCKVTGRESNLSRDDFDRTGDLDKDLVRASDGRGRRACASAFGSISMAADVRDVLGEP